jgi:glycosyltransferase involved in cell wall biosynthesis
MKVLMITNSLGDSGQYFIPYLEGLIERGHEITIISEISDLMCQKLARLGIKYLNLNYDKRQIHLLSSTESMIRLPFYSARIVQLIKGERIDVVHVHHPIVPFLLGSVVSKMKRIPLVLTIHGGPPSIDRKLCPICEANRVTVTSPEQRVGLPKCSKEILSIPLPIDLSRFSPNSEAASAEETRKIAFISRLDPDKIVAVYSVIEAAVCIAREFKDAQVIVAGDGLVAPEVRKAAERVNNEIGREVIVLPGFVEDIPRLMREAHIVIGVGVIVMEAMAAGKPVIVAGALTGSRGGSFGGVLDEQNVELLRSHNFSGRNSSIKTNAKSIYEAVYKLLKDEQYMAALGAFGRRFAEREFGPDKIAKEIESVYVVAWKEVNSTHKLPSLIKTSVSILSVLFYQLAQRVALKFDFK